MLEIIILTTKHLAPETNICDFEYAAFNAFSMVFPGIGMKGCLFLMEQILIKRGDKN